MKTVGIIGASIAGGTLANLLGREGAPIYLIDADNFPRRKPCGEGLSSEGASALYRLKLIPDDLLFKAKVLSGYEIHLKNKSLRIDSGRDKSLGIERNILDSEIVKSALQNRSVIPHFGKKVRKISGEGPFVIQFENAEIRVDSLIYASGNANSLIPESKMSGKRFGISSVWEGDFQDNFDRVKIILHDGYEIFLTPLGKNRVNGSILGTKDKLKIQINQKSATELIENALRAFGFTGKLLGETLGSFSVGNGKRNPLYKGGILIGDAVEEFDAVGGMGMTHAILSAEILSKVILAGHSISRYVREREQMARPLRGFTRAVSFSLLNELRPAFKLKSIFQAAAPLFAGAINSTRTKKENIGRFALNVIGAR